VALGAAFLLRDQFAFVAAPADTYVAAPTGTRLAAPAAVPSARETSAVAVLLPPVEKPSRPSADRARRPAAAAEEPKLALDIVRIGPDVSVFAGRAPLGSRITILAEGQVVASAKADATGSWMAVIERQFAPGQHEFSLRAEAADGAAVTEDRRIRLAVAPTAPRGAPALPREAASAQARVPPAPVTFLYNEATFTPEGRKAAAVLAAYLTAQRWTAVSLSGHADERGSEHYNMELSRQRLDAVAGYLRDAGFAGRLELIPKGKSEPYASADRRTLSREQSFQLDRRVELRGAR
jgi:outer membrane protein OmpA-like peptidoglycan-associated protein